MAFTTEEERILKLMVADLKAKAKLNAANVAMGNEIRTEFKTIDERIRAENAEVINLLQADVKNSQTNLKLEFG